MTAYNWQTQTINSIVYRLINTAADFLAIGDGHGPATEAEREASMYYNYRVTADLDFGGATISPLSYAKPTYIGGGPKSGPSVSVSSVYYSGIFDGNFKRFYNGTVRNGYVSKTIAGVTGGLVPYAGLFSGKSAIIRKVRNELNFNLNAAYSVPAGGMAGINTGLIENCYLLSSSGLLGYNATGGIAGIIGEAGKIRNCYNRSSITGFFPNYAIAGIVGSRGGFNTAVLNCYNTGVITCSTTSNAYGVSPNPVAGHRVEYSFYSNPAVSGASFGGTLLTDAQMKDATSPILVSTIRALGSYNEGIGQWFFQEGSYPQLESFTTPPATPASQTPLFFGAGF